MNYSLNPQNLDEILKSESKPELTQEVLDDVYRDLMAAKPIPMTCGKCGVESQDYCSTHTYGVTCHSCAKLRVQDFEIDGVVLRGVLTFDGMPTIFGSIETMDRILKDKP